MTETTPPNGQPVEEQTSAANPTGVKPDYNRSEPVLGVLGLAPYATIDFLRKLTDETPARKDWEHVRILLDSNTKIPSRGRALELGEQDPSPYMREAILDLHAAGAAFVVIPCNTAHCFYDSVVEDLGVTVLHIIEETARYVARQSPGVQAVGLLASRSTVKHKLYEKAFEPLGVRVITLPELQDTVSDVIEQVKIGNDGRESRERTRTCADKLVGQGAEAIVLGCTEISLVLDEGELPVPVHDANRILAKVALRRIKQGS